MPSFNESRYREKVALRGRLGLLEQRSVVRYGHSEKFTPEDIVQAHGDLVLRAARDGDDDDDDHDKGPQAAAAPGQGGAERRPADEQMRR